MFKKLKPAHQILLIVALLATTLYVALLGARLISYDFSPHEAAAAGDNVALLTLIVFRGRMDEASGGGATPLCIAAVMGRVKTVHLLLRLGYDPDGRAVTGGARPMIPAAFQDYDEIVKLLLRYGASYELPEAVYLGDIEAVRARLDLSPQDIDALFQDARPLYTAVMQNNSEMVKLLLEYDPSLSFRYYPKQRTVLEIARDKDYAEISDLLESAASERAADAWRKLP